MEKRTAKTGSALAFSMAVVVALLPGQVAFAKDHDCCIFHPAVERRGKGEILEGTVKHFDAQKGSVTVEMKESKKLETFQLKDHLKQKDNEYRELFVPGNEISGKWDGSKEGYRIQK